MTRLPQGEPMTPRPAWVRQDTDWTGTVATEAGRLLTVALMDVHSMVTANNWRRPYLLEVWFEVQPSACRRILAAPQAATLRLLANLAGGWVAWEDVAQACRHRLPPGIAADLVPVRPWELWLEEVARG